MKARRWVKRLWISLACVFVLVAGLGVWVVVQNDFAVREVQVTIPGPKQPLKAVLALPTEGEGRRGLVVFAHGDGEADASRDGFYRPIWEAFARAGYASLSWNKPGIDGAPGNWLHQSMSDRSAEVEAALDWAKRQPEIDPNRLGLWGISQGGWVLPKVAGARTDLRFTILVGAAVNWLRQGEYNLRAQLHDQGAPDGKLDTELRRRAAQIRLLEEGVGYDEYLASGLDNPPMSKDRWGFVLQNFRADVTAQLPKVRTPTLLVLGERDRNVDVKETEAAYRAGLPRDLLTVERLRNGSHNAVKYELDNPDSLWAVITAVAAPRSLYVPGYLDMLTEYVKKHGR
ncbi:alpha/beta hydrolase family protein [Streptosporangium roseum]|uniref:alpha/beta hydrolase family protein n=1 Tax=Streptosporangium roseum TaxID=2001 RepID=UPI0004CCE7DD|nr:alpha/beta hydrolase [Streptosporangium roseum]